MRLRKKHIVWLAVGFLTTAAIAGVWAYFSLQEVIRDCYAQWGTAEIIILFHQDHGHFPSDWNELKSSYGDGKGLHHGGQSFLELKARMVVEFPRLTELQKSSSDGSKPAVLPGVVRTKSGRKSHWQGAEPNELIYEYLHEPPEKPESSQ